MSQRNPQNERYTVERETRAPGSTRPSAGAAKPASKAAASVRIEQSKSQMTRRQRALAEQTMSKEERKAQRAKERELENAIYTATTILTNDDPKYKQLRRIWWALLITAVVFVVLSWATLATGIGGQALSTVVIVIAYIGIIGALIMDFTVIRKRRNVFRDKVNAMTRKQVDRIIEDSYLERTAEEAAKKARKEAKKAGKSTSEQDAAAEAARAEVLSATKAKRRAEDAAEAASKAVKGAKGAKGKAAKAGKGAQGGGTTKVSVVSEDGSAPTGGETPTSGAADDAAATDEAAEEARKEAARKIAREFAASKGRM